MWFWIERPHQMLQRPLSAAQVQAFNQRGSLLADSKSVLRLTLQGGEMFWVVKCSGW
jgi:hypothetical protein